MNSLILINRRTRCLPFPAVSSSRTRSPPPCSSAPAAPDCSAPAGPWPPNGPRTPSAPRSSTRPLMPCSALSGSNIFNVSVRGRFDDCQDLVKELKQEEEFSKLGAVNSINWGRISSQVPYFFSGYLQAAAHVGDEVDFVVPTGNFGNILSGYIAKRMGVPIRRLIVATN